MKDKCARGDDEVEEPAGLFGPEETAIELLTTLTASLGVPFKERICF